MKKILLATLLLPMLLTFGCRQRTKEKSDGNEGVVANDTVNDLPAAKAEQMTLGTRPRTVLLTGLPQFRLTPIMKMNIGDDGKSTFYGSINFREEYQETEIGVNDWHDHVLPGYEAACGFNIVNVSHFDTQAHQQRNLFDSLVLIKTLYFPCVDVDTLNQQPVRRNCYMVSVFDEDTNKDGFFNQNDLRRFYYFSLPTLEKVALVPKDHNVVSAEYDPGNDFLYVFTRKDLNQNGKTDQEDEWHVFWVDAKDPKNNGLMF